MSNGSHQQKNRLIVELTKLYWNTDSDLNYEQAIADGSWPSSVKILGDRLSHAIAIRVASPENTEN